MHDYNSSDDLTDAYVSHLQNRVLSFMHGQTDTQRTPHDQNGPSHVYMSAHMYPKGAQAPPQHVDNQVATREWNRATEHAHRNGDQNVSQHQPRGHDNFESRQMQGISRESLYGAHAHAPNDRRNEEPRAIDEAYMQGTTQVGDYGAQRPGGLNFGPGKDIYVDMQGRVPDTTPSPVPRVCRCVVSMYVFMYVYGWLSVFCQM